MRFLAVISTLVVTAAAVPATSPYPKPILCGTINLQGGKTQTIYRDACYKIEGKAVSATVVDACTCNFSQWDTCDAGKVKARGIYGVPVTEAKGYWCNDWQPPRKE